MPLFLVLVGYGYLHISGFRFSEGSSFLRYHRCIILKNNHVNNSVVFLYLDSVSQIGKVGGAERLWVRGNFPVPVEMGIVGKNRRVVKVLEFK